MLNQPLQNRLCTCSKTGFAPMLNQPLQNRLCACSKTGFVPDCVYINIYLYFLDICLFFIDIYIHTYIKKNICKIYIYIFIYTQSILVFDTMQVLYWPVWGLTQFCSFDRRCKTCLDTKLVLIPLQKWLCACSKTSFVPSLDLLHQNRLCACS